MQSTGSVARATTPAWRLELLGGAALSSLATRHALERKTAGVLAMLAIEGDCGRSRVAGLLWPDADEERARANLRQCLHRLKKLSGNDLVRSGERLSLVSELEVDTLTLESRAFLGDDAGLLVVRGEILEKLDFDDCPEFLEWLEAQRERWRGARVAAYRRVLQNANTAEALTWAQEWIHLEPVSEEAYRALALAYHTRGDRAQALQTLRDLEQLLRRELGVDCSTETLALRESLEKNRINPTVLPAVILNPPILIGREQQWARLEQAWAAGTNLILRGVPGVGKTRLMLDFLASKGKFDRIEGRPGDAGVPMSAFARALRSTLNADTALPEWVRSEVARLIPELGDTPPPMTSEADKVRFYGALFAVAEQRFAQSVRAIAVDDLQFMDTASFEAAQYNTERANELGIRTITAYRSGELAPELEAQIEQVAANGTVQIIDLGPLQEPDLESLVQSLRLDVPMSLVGRLQQSTGGNPLYALETLRNLLEQQGLQSDLSQLPLVHTNEHEHSRCNRCRAWSDGQRQRISTGQARGQGNRD